MQKQGTLQPASAGLRARLRIYWTLTKSLQTGLLIFTGVAGFMSARCPVTNWQTLLAVIGSLFLAVSGSTMLNMVYDRDIDARMARTAHRPLPAGLVSPREVAAVGLALSALGVGWALWIAPLYGAVVFAGLFFDVVVYTIWLKRRTPWSIVWGGISGGMPVLAGRALGVGQIDAVGVLLAVAVLLWIPTHIMTYSVKYARDYAGAGVPVFPNLYGVPATHTLVAASTALAVLVMTAAAGLIGLKLGCMHLTIGLGGVLIGLAVAAMLAPSARLNFGLFKFASLYMLGAMALIIAGV
jgi:protoheme IX farnesyltransferase